MFTSHLSRTGIVCVFLIVLSGCAGRSFYNKGVEQIQQGNMEEGISNLQEAVKSHPYDTVYRTALVDAQSSYLNQLLLTAEQQLRNGDLEQAESTYQRAQKFFPGITTISQAMTAIERERRHQQIISDATALLKKGGPSDLDEAINKLRVVLAENPTQTAANALKEKVLTAQGLLREQNNRLADSYRAPITVEFHDAPLKSIFDFMAKVSGLNFYFDRNINLETPATIFSKNTSFEETLNVLLLNNQLEKKILNPHSLMIYPNTPQKNKDYQNLITRAFYVTNADVKTVSNNLKFILKARDVVIDERLGLLIIKDTPAVIRQAEQLIALQDLSDPEVILDITILEVSRSKLNELGIDFPSQLSLAPIASNGSVVTLFDLAHSTSRTTQATISPLVISANRTNHDNDILANPSIRVRNKEKANILIGDRVPVFTSTTTSTGVISESVNYVDVGVKLEVEPTIYYDSEVAIKIKLEVSNLLDLVTSRAGTQAYRIGTRNASTVLRLKDGERQILAGLINNTNSNNSQSVPILGQIPLLGRLFRSESVNHDRNEILLSITPRLVRQHQKPSLGALEFIAPPAGNTPKSDLDSELGVPLDSPRSLAPTSPSGSTFLNIPAPTSPASRSPQSTATPLPIQADPDSTSTFPLTPLLPNTGNQSNKDVPIDANKPPPTDIPPSANPTTRQ